MYWGDARLSGSRRVIYNLLTQFKKMNRFTGHVKSSPFFWGDHCQKQIQFVRNFVFPEINTLKACPEMPYHDSKKKYVVITSYSIHYTKLYDANTINSIKRIK